MRSQALRSALKVCACGIAMFAVGNAGRRQQLDSCTKLAHRRIDRCDSIPAVGVPLSGCLLARTPAALDPPRAPDRTAGS